jgi:hypothetical protein
LLASRGAATTYVRDAFLEFGKGLRRGFGPSWGRSSPHPTQCTPSRRSATRSKKKKKGERARLKSPRLVHAIMLLTFQVAATAATASRCKSRAALDCGGSRSRERHAGVCAGSVQCSIGSAGQGGDTAKTERARHWFGMCQCQCQRLSSSRLVSSLSRSRSACRRPLPLNRGLHLLL